MRHKPCRSSREDYQLAVLTSINWQPLLYPASAGITANHAHGYMSHIGKTHFAECQCSATRSTASTTNQNSRVKKRFFTVIRHSSFVI
jgi:hypothetical protein